MKSQEWYARATASGGEYIKVVTALSVGSLAAFFIALTAKVEPPLTDYQKKTLLAALIMMSLSTFSGIINWWADAQWAYASGKRDELPVFLSEKDKEKNWSKQEGRWHKTKEITRVTITIFFLIGVIAAAVYMLSRLSTEGS